MNLFWIILAIILVFAIISVYVNMFRFLAAVLVIAVVIKILLLLFW